eukprot:GDKH01006899.1.p2 GENE.GDKH01006899.1~~GDKH01006899.1.p2  ORF type:complete len:114 (+),score=20.64 GDKH01006899.1:84-425(+)
MSFDIENLGAAGARDPFAKNTGDDAPGANLIHLRLKQRNGRKTLTFVEGISPEFDYKKLLKAFKKLFNTNGAIMEDEDFGQVIQVQGDHRAQILEFLTEEGICDKEQIRMHGT